VWRTSARETGWLWTTIARLSSTAFDGPHADLRGGGPRIFLVAATAQLSGRLHSGSPRPLAARRSLKAGSLDRNCRQAHLLSPNLPLGVCNRWAKNATIGIDRGTPDWLRDDARLAAPNTYGSFWDAANRGNRLVDARRTVVIANGASRQRRSGRNGSARCGARNGTLSWTWGGPSGMAPRCLH